MACLFQALESLDRNDDLEINAENIHSAAAICTWYLNQFNGVFGPNSHLSEDVQNADQLWVWFYLISFMFG